MRRIKTGAAVLNQTALDWDNNQANIIGAIRRAKAEGVSLLCLPELAITGYGCEDAFHSPGTSRMAWAILKSIVPETEGMVVAVGLPVFHRSTLYNCACLIVDGQITGFAAKQNLAGDGIHYEPRFFKPWPTGVVGTIEDGDESYPIGDLVFDVNGVRMGLEICEDAWVATRPGSSLVKRGVDVILNPSASHFAFGKQEVRNRFAQEGSRAFGVAYIYANQLGNDSGRAIYDGGAVIATQGRMVAIGKRFSFADHQMTSAVIDLDANRVQRAKLSSYQPQVATDGPDVVKADFPFPITDEPLTQEPTQEEWEKGDSVKNEEFFRAQTLGLFDYMRKSRSKGFVVSISGGVDSAACVSLVHLMVHRGVSELGVEGFISRSLLPVDGAGMKADEAVARLTKDFLNCAYQATRNSGDVTRNAARGLAESIGATYHELDVDPLLEGYVKMIEGALGRNLEWDTDDLALQNIQARVRSPGIWMLANITGGLLLSTSNRSEAAVGYATMDGDTSGGLSPIAGIDKAFLRQWLRWLESEGPEGGCAIPALKAVNDQEPTAELRPQEMKQTDEDDLMPYEVLDAIENLAIRDKFNPVEVLSELKIRFPDASEDLIKEWIRRFFRLWTRNQWKRERYAPSFHVDDKNLDPKTWCRFPILSGGFARELKELDD